MRWIGMAALAALVAVGCAGGTSSGTAKPSTEMQRSDTQPYARLESRPIKALAPERFEDLLAGRGAGYALAAELNHYPGPRHVLDLASELQLRPDQQESVRQVFSGMEQDARRYGKDLVELEAELDRAFSSGTIATSDLTRLTEEIAELEGQVRRTHLAAHLEMRRILTPEQVAHYDRLRGYADGNSGSPGETAPHTPGQHGAGGRKH